MATNLTAAQNDALNAVRAAGPEGLLVWATSTAISALVRKGLVKAETVRSKVLAREIPEMTTRFELYTLRGKMRRYTQTRFTVV